MTDGNLMQISILEYSSYRDFLRDYIRSAKAKNRSWSYANWAKRLGVSKSSLVMIMQGRRNPGAKFALKLGENLGFDQKEQDHFLKLIDSEKKVSDPIARLVFLRGNDDERKSRRRQWLLLVLLDMFELSDFQKDPKWIRERLLMPVPESEIATALQTLAEKGFVAPDENGKAKVYRSAVQREMGGTLTEGEILQFHQDGSQAAVEALVKAEKKDRVFATSILRIANSRLEDAKAILSKTQSELSRCLETRDGESVYELHLHLFPLTKKSP